MAKSVKELQEEYTYNLSQARAIWEKAGSEGRDNLTDEERADAEKYLGEAEKLKGGIKDQEQRERLEMAEAESKVIQERRSAPITPYQHSSFKPLSPEQRSKALASWALLGTDLENRSPEILQSLANAGIPMGNHIHLRGGEYRSLSSNVLASGGYAVPSTFSNALDVASRQTANFRNVCKVIRTPTGQTWPYPQVDDSSNNAVGTTSQGTSFTATTTLDPSFTNLDFKWKKYHSGIVRCSIEFIQDNVVNFENVLAEMLVQRCDVTEEADFCNGAGGGNVGRGLFYVASNAAVQLASGNAIDYKKLKQVEHKIQPKLRSTESCMWFMHDLTFSAIEQVQDSTGRPILVPDVKEAGVYRLFGYKIFITNSSTYYIGNEGTNQPLVAFVRPDKYVIRDIDEGFTLTKLVELYAGNDQIGFKFSRRSWADFVGQAGTYGALNSYS